MICPECGAEFDDNRYMCPVCGAVFDILARMEMRKKVSAPVRRLRPKSMKATAKEKGRKRNGR